MPFLSIIVPIYNVEKYLSQCIESVLNQSFVDYELILVDDGSPDGCGKICEKYAQGDERIKVIHKKNGGLSDARNSGMKIAKGEYIIFLDSDDYMKEAILESIMQIIKKDKHLDMIICPFVKTYATGKEIVEFLPIENELELLTQEGMLSKLIINSTIFWGAGKNIYRKEIIEDNNLLFKVDLIGAEDCEFFMRFIRLCNKFCLINKPIVHYRLGREGSITNIMSTAAIMGQLQVFYDNYYIYKYNNYHKNKEMEFYFANKFANTISLLHYLKYKDDCFDINSYIITRKNILHDTKGIKYVGAKLIWLLFGFYRGSKILQRLNKYKK